MRILIIEDDTSLCELLAFGLEQEGFATDLCHNGEEGLLFARQNIHDLILLDRMLPERSGEEILRALRTDHIQVPVIFITALGDAMDKIECLDLGADDYLVKPFDIGELLARIRSVLRRTAGDAAGAALSYGDLQFYEQEARLIHAGASHLLPPRESELLAYLMRHKEKVVSRTQLIGNVWGIDSDINDGNLDNYIYLLRRRLAALGSNVRIETVHRTGYCLNNKATGASS